MPATGLDESGAVLEAEQLRPYYQQPRVLGLAEGELPLPVAGLMSTESAEAVEEKLQALKAALKAHGISEDIDAFMTLAFVSLPVIPKLRLNTYGIVDVDAQQIVPAVF